MVAIFPGRRKSGFGRREKTTPQGVALNFARASRRSVSQMR
jgi:hypothetical protein